MLIVVLFGSWFAVALSGPEQMLLTLKSEPTHSAYSSALPWKDMKGDPSRRRRGQNNNKYAKLASHTMIYIAGLCLAGKT